LAAQTAPERTDGCRGQPGEQRDVQAADRHQVCHAGVAKQRPVGALDGSLLSHHECRQHAGGARRNDTLIDGLCDRLPRAFHGMPGRHAQSPRHERARTHPNVAGGTDAHLPQPTLAVEAVRIEAAVRALEPHLERPALARDEGRPLRSLILRDRCRPVPAQQQPRRHAHPRPVERGLLDHEFKALARGPGLR